MKILKLDKNALIGSSDFNGFMDDEHLNSFFYVRGIDIKDAHMFFKMLTHSTHTEEVDVETFVEACLRIKGFATSIDLHLLNFEVRVIAQAQSHFFTHVEKQLDSILNELQLMMIPRSPS